MSRISGIGPQSFCLLQKTADDFNNPNLQLRDRLDIFESRYKKYKDFLRSDERDR